MNKRSYRVAYKFLQSQTEDEEKKKEEDRLSDDKIKEIAKDALDRYYSAVIQSFLRQLDTLPLFLAADYSSSKFSDTGVPREELSARLSNQRNRVLSSVREVAFLNNDSITDTILAYVKTQKNMSEDDIDSYVRSFLGDLRRDTIRFVRRIEGMIE